MSIQSKFVALILATLLTCAMLVGGVGVLRSRDILAENSVQIMNQLTSEKAQELNNILSQIESSVEVVANCAVNEFDGMTRARNDKKYLNEYNSDIGELLRIMVENTEGAIGSYIRYNPKYFPSDYGVFINMNHKTGKFENIPCTDLSLYTEDDRERVGWYYEPVDAGKPTWVMPYLNRNTDEYMLSYVIPLYIEGELLGVVGMDIDFNYITNIIDEITVYRSGYAFLIDSNNEVIHHKKERIIGAGIEIFIKEYQEILSDINLGANYNRIYEYIMEGNDIKVALRSLRNNMILAIAVPSSEIYASVDSLVTQMIIIAVVIVVISLIITVNIVRMITAPLKELTVVAEKIAMGDLSSEIEYHSDDEVGILAESFRKTTKELRSYMDYINSLAYTDTLTKVKNNTAYQRDYRLIDKNIKDYKTDFAIVIMDVNGLKSVNDTYGHHVGNELIISAASIASDIMGHDNIYRIGGDEFVAIIESPNEAFLENIQTLFNEAAKAQTGNVIPAAAFGYAVFNRDTDKSVSTVFNRADNKMYAAKAALKENGFISRISERAKL